MNRTSRREGARHRALSWRPRRSGDLYCAPACGRGCTRAEYEQARDGAKALARTLGPGWKPRVWENLGWHYTVQRGELEVHPPGFLSNYRAYLNAPGHQLVGVARSPRVAVRRAVRAMEKLIEDLQGSLAGVR